MGSRPHIVIVICHDLGRHLGCYGLDWVRTPHIDRFANGATRLERSFCTAPQCSPSRAAFWTGRFPHANGVVGLSHAGFANDLNEDERHLAQILGEAGYQTHLFGIQHEARQSTRNGYHQIHGGGTAPQIAERFADFLADWKPDGRPLFAQFGFFEPHRPFPHQAIPALPHNQVHVPEWLPDIPEVREDLAELEASAACADLGFGRILTALENAGIADETIVIFTADHGIAFPHAKMTLYDPGIEVPFIIRLPGQTEGAIRPELISQIDVLPTLLELLGIALPNRLHGRSFAPLLTGAGDYTPREELFAEMTYHTYYDPMRCIRTDRWKLIVYFEFAPYQMAGPDYDNNMKSYPEIALATKRPHGELYHPPCELFDLKNDPNETTNLADSPEHQYLRLTLSRRLRQWMTETADPLLAGPIPQGCFTERMAAFKAL